MALKALALTPAPAQTRCILSSAARDSGLSFDGCDSSSSINLRNSYIGGGRQKQYEGKNVRAEGRIGNLSRSSRRFLLISLPLAQQVAQALLANAIAAPRLLKDEGHEQVLAADVKALFGFDGLGKSSTEYAPGKVVALAQAGDGAVLFLGMDGFEFPLQLVVGPAEAMAVLTAVQERKSSRPVTHEAWGLSLAAVGWKVDRVAITGNESNVFYSRVILSNQSSQRSVDMRPSDGIALALRCRAPLFVCKKVAENVIGTLKTDQAGKSQSDPLKRPSLQASFVDNFVSPDLLIKPESEVLIFADADVTRYLGTSVNVYR